MSTGEWTLVAAAIGAAGSMLAVAITSRRVGKTELDKWRRDEERRLIATVLTICDEAVEWWGVVAENMDTQRAGVDRRSQAAGVLADTTRQKAIDAYDRVSATLTELELVAGRRVVDKGYELHRQYEGMRHHFRGASGADDLYKLWGDYTRTVQDKRQQLVDAARQELQIERHPALRRLLRRTWERQVKRHWWDVRYRASKWRDRLTSR